MGEGGVQNDDIFTMQNQQTAFTRIGDPACEHRNQQLGRIVVNNMLYNRAGATRTYKPGHIDIANCVRCYAPHTLQRGRGMRRRRKVIASETMHQTLQGGARRRRKVAVCDIMLHTLQRGTRRCRKVAVCNTMLYTRYKEEHGDAGRLMQGLGVFFADPGTKVA